MSSLRLAGPVSRALFGLAVAVSLVVLFTPGSEVPASPPGVDKLVHGLLFAFLAFTGVWAGLRAGWFAPMLVAYAGVSEVVQALAPLGRDGTVGDFAADAVGILVGFLLSRALLRVRSSG